MDKFIIEKHNFEIYKNNLNDIINDTQESINLRTVKDEDKGWFWNSPHNVTGKELNGLVTDLMSNFQKIESRFFKNYNGLLEIYKLFNLIDEKYVVSIQKAIDNLIKTNEKLQVSQEDIKKLYNIQHETLKKIVEFNKKEIETMTYTISKNTNELNKILENQKNIEEKYENKISLVDLKNKELERKINKEIFKTKILSGFSIILLIISLILIFVKGF